ncbi:type II secretion system minor pseudopilin GspI [Aestuariibacter halophilus]|uniref:Type II secretion system protein I n=1 Tax=Fluctibacter halophilus TaxID=226011 RepID=A0ABS8G944_9ALTE|nr:type II secretion system minor pseudopilin GspI [Aestuariibacter halophilus]MCC2617048.1 type II secretion system minor pseudopilin GspI [Aestuariibacter halophilus]
MNNRGLTLLEVMVALAIFAMTGVAVMKAAGDHLNGLSQLEEITLATWVANNRVTRLRLENNWPPKNNFKGNEVMGDVTWYWQQKVLKTNDDNLRAIEVSVGLSENYTDTITTVTTYIANPEPDF